MRKNHTLFLLLVVSIVFVSCTGKYIGQYSNKKKHGRGTFVYPNGNKYVGEWKNGKRDGHGTLEIQDNEKYIGEWKDDVKHGQGNYFYNNGRKFTGQWIKDRSTRGICIYSNGDIYHGDWVDGKRDGHGTFTCGKNTKWAGNKYVGQWKDDKMHGHGTYSFNSNSRYTGEWQDNKQNGKGSMEYANGDKYTGEWQDDMRHGSGTFYYADGRKYTGQWRNDRKYSMGSDPEFSLDKESKDMMRRELYLRSIVPGWGQFYSGNTTKGYIYSGSFAFSGMLVLWSLSNQKVKRQEYSDCTNESEFDEKWNNYENATYTVWGTTGLMAAIYIVNWVDILFFNKPSSSSNKKLISFADIDRKTYIDLNLFRDSNTINTGGLYLSFSIKI